MELTMKNLSAIALGIFFAGGSAYGASDIVDTAQVISSKPIIEKITESRQECDPAPPPPQQSGSSVIAPIIGGVVGGVLGHQVGQGSGQTAATIIGATGGAVAGSAVANRPSTQPAPQQCRTIQTTREVVNGYDVTYRYNGLDAHVKMPYDPGNTVKVGVNVLPDDRPAGGANSQQYRYQDGNAPGSGDPYRRRRNQQ
jgi:uncharacterized protein YcfJ